MSLYKQYGIYGIKNKVTNKIYVGQTTINFGDRRDCHYACLRGGYGVNSSLQDDWNVFGEDSFEFVVLYECVDGEGKEDVDRLEQEYIKQYKEQGLAYNVGVGGSVGAMTGIHMSEATKSKIAVKNKENSKNRQASEETRRKMSESHKRRCAALRSDGTSNNGHKGIYKKYSVETVHKIRKMHEEDGLAMSEIADMLNLPRASVYSIATYKRWKNV